MTFFEKTKRFFEPIKCMPKQVFENVIEWVALAGYYIFTFEMLRHIFTSLVTKDIDTFYTLLIWYAIVSIILMLLRFTLYKTWWTQIMHDGMQIYYRKYLHEFIQANGNDVERIGSGRFITIIDRGIHDWLDWIFQVTFKWIYNFIICCYAIYFVFTISIFFGFLMIGTVILAGFVATIANIYMRKKRFLRQDAHKEWMHQVVVVLMSKNELLQSWWLKNILTKIEKYFSLAKEYQYPVNLWFLVIEEFPRFIFLCLRVSLYIYIGKSIVENSGMTVVDFGIFITIISFMEKSLNEFLHMTRDLLRTFSGIELLWFTFDSLTSIKWYDSGSIFSPQKKDIEINSISYAYNEARVFDNFSLTIKRWAKTALVGASGGWKTTLMKLIAGYLHPESGSISVLWNTLDKTALKSYYPHIGYLTQDPSVFDATIRENLISAISQKDTQDNEQKLINALKLAHCDFVFDLEKWLDTEIGERGVRLSGGQKQRLAIAKIFLKDPEIILLDEPTSALDSFSEEAITVALDELFKNRTVIIVAHRLQTVRKADEIIVLEHGQIAERGTHSELVEKWWIYQKMLELQSGF